MIMKDQSIEIWNLQSVGLLTIKERVLVKCSLNKLRIDLKVGQLQILRTQKLQHKLNQILRRMRDQLFHTLSKLSILQGNLLFFKHKIGLKVGQTIKIIIRQRTWLNKNLKKYGIRTRIRPYKIKEEMKK